MLQERRDGANRLGELPRVRLRVLLVLLLGILLHLLLLLPLLVRGQQLVYARFHGAQLNREVVHLALDGFHLALDGFHLALDGVHLLLRLQERMPLWGAQLHGLCSV